MSKVFEWRAGKEAFLTVDDMRLETRCFGPAPEHAPTIIMLHEGLGSASLWKDFPEKLADATGFGVFAYSRCGYGASDPVPLPRPLDYMTQEAEDTLSKVLDQIGFQRGILLGHSDGASIAALYAGGVSDHRVRGVILIAPHFFTEPDQLEAIAEAKEAYEKTDLRERLARHHHHVDNTFRGWNNAWLDPEFKEWNISETIDYLRIPVLAIQGVNDQYGTIAQIQEIETRCYSPVEVVMLDDCKHSPHIEQTDKTLQSIASFVQRLETIEKSGHIAVEFANDDSGL